jgi:hypothetical protein
MGVPFGQITDAVQSFLVLIVSALMLCLFIICWASLPIARILFGVVGNAFNFFDASESADLVTKDFDFSCGSASALGAGEIAVRSNRQATKSFDIENSLPG